MSEGKPPKPTRHQRFRNTRYRLDRLSFSVTSQTVELIEEQALLQSVTTSRYLAELVLLSLLRMGVVPVALYERETGEVVDE